MLLKYKFNGEKLKSYHFTRSPYTEDELDHHILATLDLFGFDTDSPTSEEAADMIEDWESLLLRDRDNYYYIEQGEDQENFSCSVLQLPADYLLEQVSLDIADKLAHVENTISMAANLEEDPDFKRDLALSSRYVSEIKKVVGDIFQ